MAVSSANIGRNRRFALIVANSEYDDPDLQNLAAAGQDAEALSSVLKNVDIGGFEVKILKNEATYKVNEEIETFFADRYRDDLLLLYFSCHGIKDVDGRLYYATINTRRKLLASTAISANFVNDVMLRSRSRRQMLMIDCCYGGAFVRGMLHKADKVVHTGEQFEGRGRIVLTASDSMQYSFEGDRREGVGERSVFTHAVIMGLESGEADIDKNGLVSYTELYNYAYDRVIDETPMQKPGMWVFGLEGDVVVAKNPYKKNIQEKNTEKQDPNDLILDAAENLKRGDYNSTIEYSDKAIKINPHFVVAYNIKGSALFNLGQYHEALICYEKALELRPNYIEALKNRGLTLAAIGDYNKAIESFNKSINLDPSDATIWNHKGLAFHSLGEYENAVESFDKAISLSPTYKEALNNRGTSSNELSKKEKEQQQLRNPPPPLSSAKEEKHVPSDFLNPKGAIASSNNTFSPYTAPQQDKPYQDKHFSKIQGKKPLSNNLKILIPSIVGVVAIVGVIAFAFFGSGPQPSPPVVNHPPSATQQSVTTSMNKAVGLKLSGSDQDQNDALTAAIVTNPSHGTLGEINQNTGNITYTPNPGFIGNDKFTFKVNDGKVDSKTVGTVKITVNQALLKPVVPNHPPTANDQFITTNKNTPVHITMGASDPDLNDNLTAQIVSPPSNGRLSNINQVSGIVAYTPNPGFIGNDKFTFKVNDGKVDSKTVGTISVTVKNT